MPTPAPIERRFPQSRPRRDAGSMRSAGAPAFTVTELVVVVAIIGLVVALIVPTIAAVRAKARTMKCSTNQRQLTMANYAYATSNSGRWTSSRTDTTGTIRVDGIDINNGTPHSWVKSEGANLGSSGGAQFELLKALEQGTLWPYVGTAECYLSPEEARNQFGQLSPSPTVRVRSYSFNACLGVTRPEEIPGYDTYYVNPLLGDPGGTGVTVPIERYNTATIATVKQPSRMLSTIVEDDTINWNDRSRNLGGWAIQPQPSSQRWIDLPAPWNPDAITLSYVDGSVESYAMKDPQLLRIMDGPPFPAGYSVNGPGPHWVRAPGVDADWRWFRARMNPGALPNLSNQIDD